MPRLGLRPIGSDRNHSRIVTHNIAVDVITWSQILFLRHRKGVPADDLDLVEEEASWEEFLPDEVLRDRGLADEIPF